MMGVFQVLLTLTLLVVGHGCSSVTKFGYEYIPGDDSWLRLHVMPASWSDARLRCHLEGGQLASPTSPALTAAMKSMMAAHRLALGSVFTGIHATISKGDFTAMDGTPLSNISLQWVDGEPDNLENDEDCVAMTGAGEAADVRCAGARPYFCRKDAAKMAADENCNTTAAGYKRDLRTGSCYKFHRVPRTWHRAAMACAAEAAHLAVINSHEESQVLNDLLTEHRDETRAKGTDAHDIVHVGIWDWNEPGEWLTILGETLDEAGFAKWNTGEPNNIGGKESCVSMVIGGTFNDLPCFDIKIAFICEITP